MNYFAILSDGQKFGPADIATLNQWAQENRIFPTTMLEDAATGTRIQASQVPGIIFPAPAAAPPGNYSQPPSGAYMGGPVDDGSKDIKNAWISAGFAFLCCPLIGGILAIMYAVKAQQKGHPQAQTALIVAILSLVLGFGFSFLVRGVLGGFSSSSFR